MSIEIGWAALSVIIAIIGHGSFTIWWASKITAQMDTLRDTVANINRELEKRDNQIAANWKKLDHINHRLTIVETKCKITNHETEE